MKRGLRFLLALVALHALTVFPYPWEALDGAAAWLAPSPDLAVIVAVLAVAALSGGGRVVVHLASVAVLLVPLYRFGATLMPVFYGKPFELWIDVHELPGLLHLVAHDRPLAIQIAMAAGAVGVLALVYWLILRACRVVLSTCRVRFVAGAYLLVLQVAVVPLAVRPGPARAENAASWWRSSMAAAALESGVQFVHNAAWLYEERFATAAAATAKRIDELPATMVGLGSVDVYVIFLESYGRAVLHGAVWDRYADWMRELEARLGAGGFSARAAWAAPSVHGGGSVQAHLEFMSGIEVPDRRVMDLLLASDVRVLPELLRRQGYRTVNVQPAMPRAWPEAKLLGFVQDVFQAELPYEGHIYHWGRVPDQFALQRVLETVVRPATQSLFVQYVSVVSHAPFSDVPPYYEAWAQATAPGAFAGPPARTFPIGWTNYAGHPDVLEAYLAVTEYSLKCAVDFLLQTGRPTLAFVLGDHQPPLEASVAADRSLHVPIHAISNRPELLPPLADLGFTPGLLPQAQADAFSTARFLPAFLRAYGQPQRR